MQTVTEHLKYPLTAEQIEHAEEKVNKVIVRTPLQYNRNLSKKYQCSIYLKREDMQVVRSYKLRGAFNKMSNLAQEALDRGVVCASAGNHAQGFAYSCKTLHCNGVVFMPVITPRQKVKQTKMFGDNSIEVKLIGDNFEECLKAALEYTRQHGKTFISPFDDLEIIEGQGTVGVEILQDLPNVDFLFIPLGGGGLASGTGIYFRHKSPKTRLIGVEPLGAASMLRAFEAGGPVTLEKIDSFVDGAAVKRAGDITYSICRKVLDEVHPVPEGKVCTSILKLYNEDAIVAEPAGALSVAALDNFAAEIKGKTVVCIISGGNNDIDRMQEIKERSLQFEGLKHYFLIRFSQRPGALKEFVNHVLGPHDDITRFEYMKKHNKEAGPALVGIELTNRKDYLELMRNLNKYKINYTELKKGEDAFGYLV